MLEDMVNTTEGSADLLDATTKRDLVLSAGQHPKAIAAGTVVKFHTAHAGNDAIYVYVADRPRVSGVVYVGGLNPA